MADDIYVTVPDRQFCARNCRINKRQRKLCLFPHNGPLEFVVIDMGGLLPKTIFSNEYVVGMT